MLKISQDFSDQRNDKQGNYFMTIPKSNMVLLTEIKEIRFFGKIGFLALAKF